MTKSKNILKKTEHGEQCAVIDWCNAQYAKYPMLKWIYAIPNGGDRHPAVAAKLKAEGVKRGVPDLCLPYPIKAISMKPWPRNPENKTRWLYSHGGLYVEMKVKSGSVKPHQKEWMGYLHSVGYMVAVAWSADEAIQIIENYIRRDK